MNRQREPAIDAWVLASSSPRRIAMLRDAGQAFEVAPAAIAERRLPDESPWDFALRMAREKTSEVSARMLGRWVLGADTVVVLEHEPLVKPVDLADAERMLSRLSGRTHSVVTGFALLAPTGAVFHEERVETTVEFRRLGAEEIRRYVAGGETRDKAGAYAIQGGAAAFVRAIRGSYTNVVGLPFDEVRSALRRARLWDESERPGP